MDKAKLFAAVEKALQKGQTDKALEGLEQILRIDPQDLKALSRAADLYLKEQKQDRAFDTLKSIGAVYTKDGFYSKAVAIYKRILKIDKISNPEALFEIHENLASLYGHLGLVSDAMNHFSIVVDHFDKIGDKARLLEVLKKVSELDPSNIDTQLKLAELFIQQEREIEAVETLDRMIENAESRKSVSDLIRVHEKYCELFPQNNERLESLVNIYLEAQEPKKALARIQAAFRLDPRNARILELLSKTFAAMAQPEKSKAVDIELVKLYRQEGKMDEAAVVEKRIKGHSSPHASPAPVSKSESSPIAEAVDEASDPVESLIKALPLSTEEKKVLAECDVYFKYGLTEKAYEVLKGRLNHFPQSLILRWRLKSAAQEIKKKDEAILLLSEIILLARKQGLEIWANLAATELEALDPTHPSLEGKSSSAPGLKKPPAALASAATQTKDEGLSFKDLESSEVSIIIDDEMAEDSGDVSEISFQDLKEDSKPEDSSEALILEEAAPQAVDDFGTIDLGELEATVEPLEESKEEAVLELNPEVDVSLKLDEPVAVKASAPAEEEAPVDILSESDFSAEELDFLEDKLAPEDLKPKSEKVKPQSSPQVEESSTLDLSDFAHVSSPEPKQSPLERAQSVPDEDFEVKQGLEEVEFFKSQGLEEEAQNMLKALKEKYPHRPEWKRAAYKASHEGASSQGQIAKKNLDVEALGRKVKLSVQEDTRAEGDDDFFNLAEELQSELEDSKPAPSSSAPAEVRDVFNAFKAGVSQSIAADDWQTHFDLGVAYREMGLLDDAIEEFKLVEKVDGQKVSALYQMGLTYVEMNKLEKARECWDQALKQPQILNQERLSLSYELGEVLLKLNNPSMAKKFFSEVQKIDPEFREVTERLKQVG